MLMGTPCRASSTRSSSSTRSVCPQQDGSFSEAVADLVGQQVMFDLTARPDKNNPEVVYNDVRKLRARHSA